MLRYALAAAAALCLAVPAEAATTITWNPQVTDSGSIDEFNTATQTFAPVAANFISFSGSGYYDAPGWTLWALTNYGRQVIWCGGCGAKTGDVLLSSLIGLGLGRDSMVSGLQVTYFSPPAPPAFHDFTGETFTLSVETVPEPATWAMMLLGFGLLGFALRRSRPGVRTIGADARSSGIPC